MPECWTENVEGIWDILTPYGSSSKAQYLAFKEGHLPEDSTSALLITQPIHIATGGQYDVAFDMNRLDIECAAGVGHLNVYANNSPSLKGATLLGTINRAYTKAPAELTAGWYNYSFNIPKSVKGTTYIIFKGNMWKGYNSNTISLDNIAVIDAQTCHKVSNLKFSDPTTNSIALTWDAEEGQTQWIVDYVITMGNDTVKADSVLTSSNPFVINEGLVHSTSYTISGTVQGYCSETDRAEAIAFSYNFQTACEAVTTFPYFEGFENSFPPTCWEMKNTAGNTEFVWEQNSSSTYVKEGNYCAYWRYKSSGSKAILVTPEFTFPEDQEYRIELYAYRGTSGTSYAGEGIGVYLSNTKEVTEDATLLAFIPRLANESYEDAVFSVGTVSTSGMYQYKFDFNTSEYEGKYIIFEAVTNDGYYQSFDNLWIGPKPAVETITAFTVDSVVIDAARLTIPDTLVTSFDVVYGEVGFDPTAVEESSIVTVTGRKYLFSNLTPETEYEVYVRNRKDDKVSDWSRNSVKFRTLCAPFVVDADNFYVEDFESYEANVTDLGCLVQSYGSDANYRIATEMEYYDNSSYSYVKKYPSNGSNMAYLGSANNSWLFRAVELKAGQNYSISVDGLECSTYYEAKLSFGVATTPDRSAVTPCLAGYVLPDCSDWERVTGYFTVPTDGVYYVGVGVEKGSGTVGLDSLVIRTEAVNPPVVNITALTDASVTFSLTSNAAYWEMYYATENFNPNTIVDGLNMVEKNTYTIEGLNSNTTYYYAFRSYSEKDEPSAWTYVANFKTECGAIALPLSQGFESANLECWTLSGEGAIGLRAYNKQEGSYSWNLSGNKKLISPRVDGDLSNCEGSFWAAAQYDGERYTPIFAVGVMINPQDPATYKAIDTIVVDYIVADGQLREYMFSLESLKEDAEYKDAKYFVLEHVQGYTYLDALNVDDFIVEQDTTQHQYYLSIQSNDNELGSVLVTQGRNEDYNEVNSTISFAAIATAGNSFSQWSDGNNDNPRTLTLTQDTTITAIFKAQYPNWSFDDDKPSSTDHTFINKEYYDTITIVAGKTVIVQDGATIACNDIVIKADENGNVPEIKVIGDIIANNGITFEWEIDDSRWYFFSLPFNCKIRDVNLVTIANGPSDGVWNYYNPKDSSGDFIIRDYNQKRAAQGQGKKTGWVDCEENKMLHKGRGYIIGLFPAGSKAKVHFKSEKQIQLSKFIEYELDFGEGHSWYDYAEGDNQLYNGWNLIGVPYFETFSQGNLDATYVSIPNNDGTTYTQHTLAKALTQGLLRPFMSFFIQLAENVAPTFDPTDRSNAPMLRAKTNTAGGEIVVNIHNANNETLNDKTTIINNRSKTNEYEIGYDLQKMIGYASRPQIYTIEECGLLAFNAQDVMASGIVRLGLYVPADGKYIIGGESWGAMSGAELYDIESDEATSLTIPQTIYLTKGTHDERFIIRVKQQVTTNAENNNDSEVNAYIENGRLFIENMPADGNVYVYDTAGKLVHQQSTNSNINVELIAEGIYHITIHTVNNQVINTKVVY